MSNKDWEMAADIAIKFIDDKARNNGPMRDVWDVYASQMSKNRWANKQFESLIDAIVAADRELERIFARDGDRFDDWFPEAVENMVKGSFATSCLQERELSDSLSNTIYADMKRDSQEFARLTGGRGGRNGRDDRYSSRDGGRDNGRYSSRSDRSERYERGSDNTGVEERTSRTSGGTNWRELDKARQSASAADRWGGIVSAAPQTAPAAAPVREPDIARESRPVAAPQPVRRGIEGPDHTKSRPYDNFYKDGKQYQPAHHSSWQRTPKDDPNDPFHRHLSVSIPFNDINETISFLVKHPDGTVTEEALKVNESNRYLQEELQNDPAAMRDMTPAAAPTFDYKSLGRTNEGAAADYKPSPDLAPNAPVKLDKVLAEISLSEAKLIDPPLVDSLDSAVFAARSKRSLKGDKPSISWFVIRSPVLIKTADQHSLVNDLYRSSNLTEVAEFLTKHKDTMDKGLWEFLNNRFGESFIRMLRFQFQLGGKPALTGMNFHSDLPAAIAHYGRVRGEAEAAMMATRAKMLIPLVCQNGGTDVAEMVNDLITVTEDTVLPMVFTQFAALVAVDYTLDALGIGKVLRANASKPALNLGLSIQQGISKEVYDTVHLVYEALEKEPPTPTKARVYLVTSDNYRVEILPYAGRKNSYVLAMA